MEQAKQRNTNYHDLLRWKIEEDTLLRRRFHFDPIRVALFQVAVDLFPIVVNDELSQLNTYISNHANDILSTTHHPLLQHRYPNKLKHLAWELRNPNLDPLIRKTLDKEYWSTRYRLQLSRDKSSITRMNPSQSSFWRVFGSKKFVGWKDCAAG